MNKNALKLNSVNVRHGTPIPTDSNANWERQPMTIYRRIYEQHFGPIPRDEDGRTYDIHHIDGNRKNNDPSNLIALSIKEHYKVHHDQGDYGAALRIIARMEVPPELLSELGRKNVEDQVAKGIHPFLGGEVQRKSNIKRIEEGTHIFLEEGFSSKYNRKRVEEGTHNLLGDNNPVHKKIAAGTHHFQNKEWHEQKMKKIFAEGKHPSQIKKSCPHCGNLFSVNTFNKHVNACKSRSE
jgi:hypothetical protein